MTNLMANLELPGTRLILDGDVLRKYGAGDNLIGEFDLEQIRDIRSETTAEYLFPGIMGSVGIGLAVVCRQFIPWEGWGWVGVIVCLGLAGLVFLSVHGRKIVIETADGTVGYPVSDGFEEADGFVLTIRQRLNLNRR